MGSTNDEYITKRMHLLESFLQAIVDNPFLRNDNSLALFLSDATKASTGKGEEKFSKSLVEYKAEHKDQVSEGMKWWRKALDASKESPEPEKVLKSIDYELDEVLKNLKSVKEACKHHIAITIKFSESYSVLGKALAAWERKEVDTVSVLRGIMPHTDGTKAILAHEVRSMAQSSQAMAGVLDSEYGASQLELILLDAVRYEIIQAERWKEQIGEVVAKLKLSTTRQEAVKTLQQQLGVMTSKPGQEKLVASHTDKLRDAQAMAKEASQVASDYERGALVVELGRYRKARTMRIENMSALLTRFHLRGSNMIGCAWDGTGVTTTVSLRDMEDNKSPLSDTASSTGRNSTLQVGKGGAFASDDDSRSHSSPLARRSFGKVSLGATARGTALSPR